MAEHLPRVPKKKMFCLLVARICLSIPKIYSTLTKQLKNAEFLTLVLVLILGGQE